jgi:diguanylate cyclase (GGDEF)-like protein
MGRQVLVFDDEPKVRSFLREVLTEQGHEVLEAESADHALDAYRRAHFDLVIAGVDARHPTGLSLTMEIKQQDADALVVVISDRESLAAAAEALSRGAYDCLLKPLDAAMVSAAVERATERTQLVDQNRILLDYLKRNNEELDGLNVKLTEIANRDTLTGLYNHRFFRETLEQELARARRYRRALSVILVDVDHFASYGETQGGLAADDLLRTLARLIQERCRSTTVAARYGGEQFVLLVPEVDADGAQTFAEMIRRAVEEHHFPGGESQPGGRVSVSVGVASHPEAAGDGSSLIECADKALAHATEAGRNTVAVWRPLRP